MTDSLQQISLLYELSVTTLKYLNPKETASSFIKKILSHKNLSFGAIWLFDSNDGQSIYCSNLYSMPTSDEKRTIELDKFVEFFGDGEIAVTKTSIFPEVSLKGQYAYFKLAEIALLELYDKSAEQKLDRHQVYPFKDVINQLAVSLETGFSYQNLQKEIKQRKIAEKSLKNNEQKYRRIVDNIKLGLLEVDREEVIQHANKSFCDLVGYGLDEIKGHNASKLFLFERDREKMLEQNRQRDAGESGVYQMALRSKSKEEKWVVISGAPNFDSQGNQIGSIGIHLDISEQRRLANDFAFQESKLKNLFELSLDALISINQQGEIIEWNPQAEKIFGYERKEIIGNILSETVIPQNFKKAHNDGMKKFHSSGEGPVLNKRIEISAIRKNGEEFPIELTIFPIKHHDGNFFTAFVRDITELRDSRDTMANALEQQTELNNLKSQFVSMTSHELRTPLTTISTDVELLGYHLEQPAELNRERFIKIISRIDINLDRLNHLINNILLIGQLDTHKVPFSPENTDVLELVSSQVLPNYLNGERILQMDAKGSPFEVKIDRKLFTQVLDNLIGNAFKYSEDKPGPEIIIDYQENDLLIHVKDHGIGIPEKEQSKLFSTFFRASNVGGIQGSGLGLSIVNEFVKLHNGLITFNSKINEGTTFTAIFPKK